MPRNHRRHTLTLAVHILSSSLWLGALTTITILNLTPPPTLLATLTAAAVLTLITGAYLARNLTHHRWVRIKLTLATAVFALAGLTTLTDLTGRPALCSRTAGIAGLTTAIAVSVIKPRRKTPITGRHRLGRY
jgi:uncharacterized membrane protein YfcA